MHNVCRCKRVGLTKSSQNAEMCMEHLCQDE